MLQGRPRLALFLLFVGSFFVVSGSILFYAFGYRYSFERGIFVYGGSITLKSNPVQIDIKIDGQSIPPQSLNRLNQSYHLAGIPPGEHAVEVSASGYQTWSKRVMVRSGLSNEFWNITLPRQNYDLLPYAGTEGFTRYFQSPEPTVFAGIAEHDQQITIAMFDTESKEAETLYFQTNARFSFEKNENLEWSTDGDRIVFPVMLDGSRHVLTVDVETKEVRDLTTELSQISILRPRWNPSITDSLLYLSENKLYRVDIGNATDTPLEPLLLTEPILTYDLSGPDIYIAHPESKLLYRFKASEERPKLLPVTDTPIQGLTDGATLIVYDEYRIAILSTDGSLAFFNAYLDEQPVRELAERGIVGVQFSDDGKKLLFFGEREINTYFIRPWEVQPRREQNSVWQISRFADPISSAQWTKDYEHVLYLKGSQVFVTELDNRDQRNIHELIRFEAPPLQILSRVNANQVFFVTDASDSTKLVSIDFPEFNSFFAQ